VIPCPRGHLESKPDLRTRQKNEETGLHTETRPWRITRALPTDYSARNTAPWLPEVTILE
jgi:hypothetical protein